MGAYSRVFVQEIDDLPPPRAREFSRVRGHLSKNGDYGHPVPPPIGVRKKAFAAFVARAIRVAETDRGWSVPRIAEEARRTGSKLSNQTIYRWKDGDWVKAPDPDAVLAFCDVLDIDPKHAWAILWPGKNEAAPPPEPAPLGPDIEQLARRLRDPNVSEAEKVTIRATVRHLAGRSTSARADK
jgi:hypothetical protein